jgi:hypothetical protein
MRSRGWTPRERGYDTGVLLQPSFWNPGDDPQKLGKIRPAARAGHPARFAATG